MSRCLIVAPLARDLSLEHGDTVRVPGAATATVQWWDSLAAEYWTALADAALTIYTKLAAIPLALKKHLVRVKRYDDVTASTGAGWKHLTDCGTLDFITVVNTGVTTVKAVTTLIAGDRPVEWVPMHHWFGHPGETLGAP